MKGVYVAQNCDKVSWDDLGAIKARDGFKIMWEIEGPSSYKQFRARGNAAGGVDLTVHRGGGEKIGLIGGDGIKAFFTHTYEEYKEKYGV